MGCGDDGRGDVDRLSNLYMVWPSDRAILLDTRALSVPYCYPLRIFARRRLDATRLDIAEQSCDTEPTGISDRLRHLVSCRVRSPLLLLVAKGLARTGDWVTGRSQKAAGLDTLAFSATWL